VECKGRDAVPPFCGLTQAQLQPLHLVDEAVPFAGLAALLDTMPVHVDQDRLVFPQQVVNVLHGKRVSPVELGPAAIGTYSP
jgi:hypothetical protein